MRIIAAYLLAVLGGKQNPDAAVINKILGAVGIQAEAEEVKRVIDSLSGKDIDTLIKEGKEKLAAIPSGGGGGGGGVGHAAPAAGGAAPAAGGKKEEAPKEKEKEEEEEADMGFSLFD